MIPVLESARFCGAAAALNLEYTLPEVSQSVIITRTEGKTPVLSGKRSVILLHMVQRWFFF